MPEDVWSVENQVLWNYILIVESTLWSTTADIYRYNNTQPEGLPEIETKEGWSKSFSTAVVDFVKEKRHDGEHDDDDDDDDDDHEHKNHDDGANHDDGDTGTLTDFLSEIIEFADSIIPEKQIPRTPVFLHGTGSMRSLDRFSKHHAMRNACVYFKDSTKYVLNDCNKQVYAIHEDVESLLNWVAVNYRKGQLNSGNGTTTGSLLLSNGSFAESFVSKGSSKAGQYKVSLPLGSGIDQYYDVAANAYDDLGLSQVWKDYLDSSEGNCLQKGLKVGTLEGKGDYAKCMEELAPYFKKANTLPEDLTDLVGLDLFNSLHDLFEDTKSVEEFCNSDWESVSSKTFEGWDSNRLEELCLSAAYSHGLIEQGLFPSRDEYSVEYTGDVKWTLGRALFYAVGDVSKPSSPVGLQSNVGSTKWQFALELKRPPGGDWADRLDKKSHRLWGGIVFIGALFFIVYLLLGKTKRRHILESIRGRKNNYQDINANDFELRELANSEDEFDV